MHGVIYLNNLNKCLITHFIIESVIKDFCRLVVSNVNPGIFEINKRWGSCLTASLQFYCVLQ